MQRHEPRPHYLGLALGDPVLDDLAAGEGLAVGPDRALVRATAHHVESTGGDPHPTHAVMDPTGSEPLLGDDEARALIAEEVRLWHAARLVDHLAVRAVPRAGMAHHVDVANEFEAGSVGRDDDHARPLVRRGVGVGDRHDDGEVGAVGRRREPLVAVDDIVVTVLGCRGVHHHGIGPGHVRLGHRATATDLALDKRAEEALALLVGGVHVEDLDVACVGGLAPEHGVAKWRAAKRLGEHAVVDQAQAEPAVLDRVVRRPQLHLADHLLLLGDESRQRLGIAVEHLTL